MADEVNSNSIDTMGYSPQNQYDKTIDAVNSVLKNFPAFVSEVPKKTIFLGFDGYIDSLYSMVSERENAEKWTRMSSMKEFGERILATAGSSCNIERVLKKRLAGGFAPNMARAISHFGSKVYLAAAMGSCNIDPLFLEYPKSVELFSIQDPGETAGFEFDDGKVMATDFGNINNITWDTIIDKIPRDKLIELIEKSDGIGMGHWSLMPNMNSFWSHMIDEIFPNLSNGKKKIFMVDPADLKKRTDESIIEMLKLLQKIDEFVPAMISMNDREAMDISNVLSSDKSPFTPKIMAPIKEKSDYIEFTKKMNEMINISYVVTHDPHFATISTKDDHVWVTEGYTSKPRFTTAAGDHFNGAVLISLVSGLKPMESLVIGNALTAIFVRTGVSVQPESVKRFVSEYFSYVQQDRFDFKI